ncbi:LOW QUALITY PROTEIN: WD repeat-containing protein 76-like [Uloborus diversus]|uniref:LOW QUALITY PROTEIN: WD repeat-containing protein 76-like n=1 Tax=Uloborus diversus TaxID=327109 RepID=UPI00240A1A41|nr:LOW QUALITY PROTEIN: WD repeat-containing protein 76-like [Uloborus diversus]
MVDSKHQSSHLSPYEKMILKNKQEKMKFLQSLKIDEAKEDFTSSVRKIKPVRKPVKRVNKKFKPTFTPIRKSRRLAKLDVDLSEDALYYNAVNKGKSRGRDLKLSEDNIAKVVPARISSMDIHPHPQNVIVCAGSKYGSMGFWNVLADSEPFLCHTHSEGITNVKFNPFDASKLISSSYDCTLRCGDMEKEMFEEVHVNETSLTYFDFLSAPVFIVSQQNGKVSIVDTRSSRKHAVSHSCHDNKVKTVSVHPLERSYFVTSDTKGMIRVWDLRKLQKLPIATNKPHKRSINSAFFSPVTGKNILSTSFDDTLAILDSSIISKDIKLKTACRHNNFTGRWLTPFRATWLPNSDEHFVIGGMGYPRKIEVFDHDLNHAHKFIDENLNSICSVNVFHPNRPVLAGGNSSGKVYVYMN